MTTKHSHQKTTDPAARLVQNKPDNQSGHFGPMKFTELFISSSKLISVYTEKTWQPPTDIYETAKEIVVRCEIAGMKPEEILISFEANHLLISGCRDERDARAKRNFRQMEINYGKFEKTIEIYGGVEPEQSTASYKDGFLEVVIPKSKKSAGHHPTIASNSQVTTIRHIEIISGPLACQEHDDE